MHTCTLNYLLWECLEYIDCRFNKRLHKYSGPVVRPSKEPSMANGMSPVFVSQAGETWFCSENSVRSLNDVLNQTRVLRTLPVGCSGVDLSPVMIFSHKSASLSSHHMLHGAHRSTPSTVTFN